MIGIQYLFSLLQVYLPRLCRLPVKSRHKVKIVIKHAVLVTVLTLLLHTVKNLISLFTSRLVHAGLIYQLTELSEIGYIFRMHLVKLLLKYIYLFFQSIFTVKPLVFLLLRLLGAALNLGHLNKLIGHFLYKKVTFS